MMIMSHIPPAPAPAIVAHRGASAIAPENTLAAFRAADAAGADLYELDVHLTKDGNVVVVHDSTLARTTNVEELYPDRKPWRVRDFTLDEIRRLDAGRWFNERYTGEPVPTLRAVMKTMKKGPGLALEVKRASGSALMAQRLAELLPLAPAGTIVQSFDAAFIKRLPARIEVGVLGRTSIKRLPALAKYADYASVRRRLATAAYVKKAHSLGLKVLTYTVNDMVSLLRALDAGVDGLMTDRPRVLRRYLDIFRNNQLQVPYSLAWPTRSRDVHRPGDRLRVRKLERFASLLESRSSAELLASPPLTELKAAYERLDLTRRPSAYEPVRPLAEAFLTLADADGDGTISKLEYVTTLTGAFGLREEEAVAAFDGLDEDARGKLTYDEIHRAFQGFFCTSTIGAYGNTLFGPY